MFGKSPVVAVFALAVMAGSAQAATVTVKVNDIASAKGEILVQLCDEAHFLKPCDLKAKAPAKRGTVSVEIRDVPPGRFAATAFHDENGDRVVNLDKLGVPTEGFGNSRDAVANMGPPLFKDAAFMVGPANLSVDVNLTYY